AWSDYCDWFLEMAKVDLRRPDASPGEQARVWLTAAEVLGGLMRLLHPIVPFVTEEIWQALHGEAPTVSSGEPFLVIAAWPVSTARDDPAEEAMNGSIELIRE